MMPREFVGSDLEEFADDFTGSTFDRQNDVITRDMGFVGQPCRSAQLSHDSISARSRSIPTPVVALTHTGSRTSS